METKVRSEVVIQVTKLVIAVLLVVLLVIMYGWVLLIGTYDPQQGNSAMAIVVLIAIGIAKFMFHSILANFKLHVWMLAHKIMERTYIGLGVLFVWHVVGSLLHDFDYQDAFLFIPVVAFAATPFFLGLGWCMIKIKEYKKDQL